MATKNAVVNLTERQRDSLRHQFQELEPTGWVIEVVHKHGWEEATKEYLQQEQRRGRDEMESLMAALRLSPPLSATEAADLVTAALNLYLPPGEAPDAVRRLSPTAVRARVCHCPTYRRVEESEWRGVTACGSWHRRQGWYHALELRAVDSILGESKWGDEACEAVIEFS